MHALRRRGLLDRIAFLGFGLIGGSIALALRDAGCHARLIAWTPAGSGPAEGVRLGFLDEAAPTAAKAIDGAGLVILAGPPLAIVATLRDMAGPMRGALADGATITDVASTKSIIVATAEDLKLPFVGGHPMAGRETSGGAPRPPTCSWTGRGWLPRGGHGDVARRSRRSAGDRGASAPDEDARA
jgi:prephenate dehydrogenase